MCSFGTVRTESLTKDNYNIWTIQMRALLINNDTWNYKCGKCVKPELIVDNPVSARTVEKCETRDGKATFDIILATSREL